MPRLELIPFRYREPLTGEWVRARYVAGRHVIAARYPEWEIIGPPEIREWREDARYFNPFRYEGSVPDVPASGHLVLTDAPVGNIESIIDFAGMALRPRRRLAIVGVAA